jgi:hypothetical protein
MGYSDSRHFTCREGCDGGEGSFRLRSILHPTVLALLLLPLDHGYWPWKVSMDVTHSYDSQFIHIPGVLAALHFPVPVS